MTLRIPWLLMCVLTANTAFAAPLQVNDYAQGIAVNASSGEPLVETALPAAVYETITRTDLGDLRVFNADGNVVPHAFCTAPETSVPAVTGQSLPVFELREARAADREGSRIEVQTAGGTQVNVQEARSDAPEAANGRTHIIDVREIDEAVRAIQFDWQSPDGASAAKVSIEASDNLDRWHVVVPASTLLLATRGSQELKRERIELPQRHYVYLRVERADGGPPLLINAVTAERVSVATDIEPLWFMPNPAGSDGADATLFDTARLAPVHYARLRLPQENSSLRIALQSRPDDKSPWRERWSGEVYLIVSGTERRHSPPAKFDTTSDRYWRVQLLKDSQGYPPAVLELGYRPALLRFLAQGPGPFTIAFGSRRADVAAPVACDGLLANVSGRDRERLIGQGYTGALRTLGGDAALKPLPKKTPVRQIVLWAVLLVGVALLIAMAASLLKRVRAAES